MNELESKFYLEISETVNYFLEDFEKTFNDELDPLSIKDIADSVKILEKIDFSNEQMDALKKVVKDTIIGVIHSLFVTIDGGTSLSDNGKALELINLKTEQPLTNGAIHENFIYSLID